jgi:Cu(I)/Ag(I) efflux system membrane fusion protein
MNLLRWGLFVGLVIVAAVSIGSYVASRNAAESVSAKAAGYYCPMHPSYTSDRPGECPICGMSLEPIPQGADSATHSTAGGVPGLAPVHLTPERIQLIGVRTARVEKRPLGARLELVGFVAPDESRLKHIQLRVAGWVQHLEASRTGESVRVGQPLLTIYSPELYQSEEEFLIELRAHEGHAEHEAGATNAGRERLRLLGVPEDEIERLERERTAKTELMLRSPVGGTVLERGVTEGQFVAAETPLFTVVDLSRVWVLADIYEMDYARVRVGDPVRFTADALGERSFEGRVELISPTVSTETRTLKVRASLPNGDRNLRPGMYGRATVFTRAQRVLAVPEEAVVKAGDQDYVFLARAPGRFEPRTVRVGQPDGDWVQILGGVAEGDTVVASASFLIDSESRLKAAVAGMGPPGSPAHGH